MEDIFHFFQLDEQEKVKVVIMSFVGEALRWFEEEQQWRKFYEWTELKILMLLRFGFHQPLWPEQHIPARYDNKLGYHEEITQKEEARSQTMVTKIEREEQAVDKTVTYTEILCEEEIRVEGRQRISSSMVPITPRHGDIHGGCLGYGGPAVTVTAGGHEVADGDLIGEGRDMKGQHRRSFERGGAEGSGSGGGPGDFAGEQGGLIGSKDHGGDELGDGGGSVDEINDLGGLLDADGAGYSGYGGGPSGHDGGCAESLVRSGGINGEGKVVGCGSGGALDFVAAVGLNGGAPDCLAGGSKNSEGRKNNLENGGSHESLTESPIGLHRKLDFEGSSKGTIGKHFKSELRRGGLVESRDLNQRESDILNSRKWDHGLPFSPTELNENEEQNGPSNYEPILSSVNVKSFNTINIYPTIWPNYFKPPLPHWASPSSTKPTHPFKHNPPDLKRPPRSTHLRPKPAFYIYNLQPTSNTQSINSYFCTLLLPATNSILTPHHLIPTSQVKLTFIPSTMHYQLNPNITFSTQSPTFCNEQLLTSYSIVKPSERALSVRCESLQFPLHQTFEGDRTYNCISRKLSNNYRPT